MSPSSGEWWPCCLPPRKGTVKGTAIQAAAWLQGEKDHKEPGTQTGGSYVCLCGWMCASSCVGSQSLSSVVKRNQTVLSYAHAGVSENTTTHFPDDMHAHAHNHSPGKPYHSWYVINRQRKWPCWGGLGRSRVGGNEESHLSLCLPSRHTVPL